MVMFMSFELVGIIILIICLAGYRFVTNYLMLIVPFVLCGALSMFSLIFFAKQVRENENTMGLPLLLWYACTLGVGPMVWYAYEMALTSGRVPFMPAFVRGFSICASLAFAFLLAMYFEIKKGRRLPGKIALIAAPVGLAAFVVHFVSIVK